MSYLIDTDWVIDYLIGRHEARQLLAKLWPDDLAISIITYLEILDGIRGGRDPRQHALTFRRFLKDVHVYGLSRPIAERTADTRIALRRQRRPINHRALDLIVAATAVEHRLVMVTRNLTDYGDVPGIQIYEPA